MNLNNALKSIGLNEKQAKVYLACLEFGSASAHQIALRTQIPRTTIYEILDSLIVAGFVNHYLKKKTKFYSAESPDKILSSIQYRTDLFKNALPELNALYHHSPTSPAVRFYQGKEQIKLALNEILKEANEISCFGNADNLLKELGDYHETFLQTRIKKKIPIHVILPDSPTARERQRIGQEQLRTVKIISNSHAFNGLTYIWKNKILMFSLSQDFEAILIESQTLSTMQLAQFNSLWDKI